MINLLMAAILYGLCALFLVFFAYCAHPVVTVVLVLIALGLESKG